MALKYSYACSPTNALLEADTRKHFQLHILPIHWQLRSLIGVASSNAVYYPAGAENLHIQEFNPITRKSTTIALLSFSPRCLVARGSWVCCGGEMGEFAAIQLNDRNTNPDGYDSDDALLDANGIARNMDEEEYDDFDVRSDPQHPSHPNVRVSVPASLEAKSQKIGTERVNCITIWLAPTLIPLHPGAYTCPVAVLSNNDKNVTLVNLESAQALDELAYPDCVNRAVLSPDGGLLAAISDDPYLYVHERAPQPDSGGGYEWRLLARHHLRGQDKNDQSVQRGSFAACFSNTGRYLAIGTQYGLISIFETQRLGEAGDAALVTCFTSSSPKSSSGAVREMSFCPGPYDLLAWTEDYGVAGVVDARNGFASRQIVQLCDEGAYGRYAVDQTLHASEELDEDRRRRQRQRQRQQFLHQSNEENAMRSISRLLRGEYGGGSTIEQTLRLRDTYARAALSVTGAGNAASGGSGAAGAASAEDAQFLEAMQERQRRRQREQREQREQRALLTREPRESREQRERERERVRDFTTGRWSLRAPAPDSENAGRSTANTAGAASNAVASPDTIATIANESARIRERARRMQSLLSAARQQPAAIPTVENEESGTDDDDYGAARVTTAAGLARASQALLSSVQDGGLGQPPRRRLPWANYNLGEGGLSMTDVLHAYSSFTDGEGEGGGENDDDGDDDSDNGADSADTAGGTARTRTALGSTGAGANPGAGTGIGAATRRRQRERARGLFSNTLLGQSVVLSQDAGTIQRAREPGPGENKDGHTAGLAWSDDGKRLYIATEGGIHEFRVNVRVRRFHPSVELR